MSGSMRIRGGLIVLRLGIVGFLVLGSLLGGASLEPWVIGAALLFVASLVASLVLALAERRSAHG